MNERSIFLAALDLPDPAERAAYLDRACRGDPGVRRGVEELLAAHGRSGTFMPAPAGGAATGDFVPAEGPGSRVGPYKLLQQIGEGGMGAVYMAEQEQPVRRMVALKIIREGMDSRAVLTRFEAERQALALMDHPNIAKVLDAGSTESGRPYFVMELVKGVPITQFCDEHQFTLRERLELFVPVCQAIQHAHQKGVIHRDIKPSNVLVALYDDKPVPKVIDFGVAKAASQKLTDRTLFTAFGQVVGTLEYMSPEQAKLNQLDIDTRSDVYALGVLLYELLTGTTPLDRARLKAAALDEVLRLIREEEPERPSTRLSTAHTRPAVAAARRAEPAQLGKVVSGELDWIVMKALEKDRTRRYETANGLARDVERYLKDEPVEACPPTAGYRLRKLARKYRAGLTAAALFAALLVAGVAISTWQMVRATRAEREARAQSHVAQQARDEADLQRRAAQEKELAAVREADKARTLAGMMQELLGSADPTASKGGDYTARQMIDDFAAGLGDRLKDQPEVEADLRTTIGQAYRYLMLNEKAEVQHRRAVELRRRVFGPDHPKVAQSLTQLAWSLRFQSKFPAAEEQARAAIAILRRFDDRAEDLAAALRILSHMTQGNRPAEGEAQLREALALAEKAAGGRPSPMVADIAHELASHLVIHFESRSAEALPIATRSVAIHQVVHGDKHPETMHGYRVLSMCHRVLGRLAEAEQDLREALAISRRAYGSQPHRLAFRTMEDLVWVLDEQFNVEAADAVLRECLATWQMTEPSYPDAHLLFTGRGFAALNRGDYADAERHFRRGLDIRRKTPAPVLDKDLVSLQFCVGGTALVQGKADEARAAVQPLVLPARMAALKSNLPAGLQLALAFALMAGSGEPTDLKTARTLAERALEKSLPGSGDRAVKGDRALALWALANLHLRSGEQKRAVDLLGQALPELRPLNRPGFGGNMFMWREMEALLVKCQMEKGDRATAGAVLRDGLMVLKTDLAANHPEIAAGQARLATVLAEQEQYGDAEPLLLAAHENLKTYPQAAAAGLKRRRADVAERLVKLYEAWGKPVEAAKWREERATHSPTSAPTVSEKK
jgi:serine/threonine protein kinase/tetratricopeptide (TPR) repeat protein